MKYKCLVMISTVSVLLAMLNCLPVQADTTYASRYAWRDNLGNIIFKVIDKERTSSYYYKTIGITISRCILGEATPSPAGEWVAFAFDSSVMEAVVKEEKGIITTMFTMKEGDLLARIADYYPTWLAELQGTQGAAFLKLDSVMCCGQVLSDGSKKLYGRFIDDGTRKGEFYGNTFWNIPDDMYCQDCGGELPNLKAGFRNADVVSQTPICALDHPNAKEGAILNDAEFAKDK